MIDILIAVLSGVFTSIIFFYRTIVGCNLTLERLKMKTENNKKDNEEINRRLEKLEDFVFRKH